MGAGTTRPAAAAETAQPASQQARQTDEELDEVHVQGRRGRQSPQQAFDWLARLVGQFTIDGYVDPGPDGTSSRAQEPKGEAICVGFGIAPGVQCALRVRWAAATGPDGAEIPGGVSTLDPAVMLFGFNLGVNTDLLNGGDPYVPPDPERYTIAHILVDNKGVAEGGAGYPLLTRCWRGRGDNGKVFISR